MLEEESFVLSKSYVLTQVIKKEIKGRWDSLRTKDLSPLMTARAKRDPLGVLTLDPTSCYRNRFKQPPGNRAGERRWSTRKRLRKLACANTVTATQGDLSNLRRH